MARDLHLRGFSLRLRPVHSYMLHRSCTAGLNMRSSRIGNHFDIDYFLHCRGQHSNTVAHDSGFSSPKLVQD